MAVPSGDTSRFSWRLWSDLVSTGPRDRTHEAAWVIHRLHGYVLLGALRRPDQAPVHPALPASQFLSGQPDYFDSVASAYIRLWKHFRATPRRHTGELDFDRLGRDLHNAGARFLLSRACRIGRGPCTT